KDPAPTLEHIRNRFGAIDELRIVAVEDVQVAKRPDGVESRAPNEAFFEVITRPTVATRRLWPHTFSLFFGGLPFGQGAIPLGFQMFIVEQYIVGMVGATITILVSIIITAFFIPNMLRKGTVDMLVVKPIHRTTLLMYKFVGGLIFMLLNTTVA